MGNVPNQASDVEDHNRANLCVASASQVDVITKELNMLRQNRDCNRISAVRIVNNTRYPLHYKNAGDSSGFFFSYIADTFGGPGRTIGAGGAGGFCHTKKSDTACGSVGYVSFTIRAEGLNYVVCLGFCTCFSGANQAGIQIRMTDGVRNSLGAVKGHGVDPSGAVLDIGQLVAMSYTARTPVTEFSEQTTIFTIKCEYNNEKWSDYTFTISDL